MVVRFAPVLLFIAASGCDQAAPTTSSIPVTLGTLTDVFGSRETIDVVRSALESHSYRLDPSDEPFDDLQGPIYRADWGVDDYLVKSGPNRIKSALQDQLSRVVIDLPIYAFGEVGCGPDFGYRVQFSHDRSNVDILFCFNCNILMVYVDGKAVGGGHFAHDNGRILKVMKKIFSNDSLIQSLRRE